MSQSTLTSMAVSEQGYRTFLGGLFILTAVGCTGQLGSGGENSGAVDPLLQGEQGTGLPGSPGTLTACEEDAALAAGRLRRLTRVELDNTFRDLFGESNRPAAALDLEPQVGAFYNSYEDLWADQSFLQKYLTITEAVASRAAGQIGALHPCAWETEEASCFEDFVRTFGEKVFRKPVTGTMAAKYVGLVEELRSEHTRSESLESLLQAMLLSPDFLYRAETALGAQDSEGELAVDAQYQLASQLSFLLWASTPDEELLQAARRGELATAEQTRAQAERMLGEARSRDGLVQFFVQLFDHPKYESMEKSADVHPMFDDDLVAEMKEELVRFVSHVVFEGEGTLDELFTAPYSFVGGGLAELYGALGEASWEDKTMLPAGQRSGLLTQAGFLAYTSPAAGTKPVKRGHFVLEKLLCVELPPLPEDVELTLPGDIATEDMTTRERFELHVERAECHSCHQYLDPIGFGFEDFDGIGRYRTEEGGLPVDSKGDLLGAGDQDGPFDGGVELAHRLAQSETLHACMARQYFRYAMGRRETPAEQCIIDSITEQFMESGSDLRQLMLATVASDLFLHRASPNQD